MAESHDSQSHDKLKTVRLNTEEIQEIALAQEESQRIEAGEPEPAPFHDGRFGDNFDDELNVGSVVWVTLGVIATTLIGFLGSWFLYQWLIASQQAAEPQPTPVVAEARAQREGQRQVPSGPLLQASPEHELREMRQEMHRLTHGYGWVDEAAGTIYIPLDKAIDKVLEQGLGMAGKSDSSTPSDSGEADAP